MRKMIFVMPVFILLLLLIFLTTSSAAVIPASSHYVVTGRSSSLFGGSTGYIRYYDENNSMVWQRTGGFNPKGIVAENGDLFYFVNRSTDAVHQYDRVANTITNVYQACTPPLPFDTDAPNYVAQEANGNLIFTEGAPPGALGAVLRIIDQSNSACGGWDSELVDYYGNPATGYRQGDCQ